MSSRGLLAVLLTWLAVVTAVGSLRAETWVDALDLGLRIPFRSLSLVSHVGQTGEYHAGQVIDPMQRNVSTTLRQWLLDFRLGFLPFALVG